ncbi:hypothetical protein [Adlercreutzia caecimuris]|uniref:hypothetical protein n=1 Tax=Adlercreutzia caecimuris TaxID=671266 RepID=UPI00258B40D8|nr:hypothetical protein [Adlercreutzia caecimuris]
MRREERWAGVFGDWQSIQCGWEYVGEVNELDGGPIRLYGANALLHRERGK